MGAAVSGASLSVLVIRVVGVGDAVAVRVRILAVIGVVRERITSIGSTVAVGVRAVRIGSARVLLGVGQSVTIGVAVGVAAAVRVEAVGHFPSIGEAVSVGVGLGHVRSVLLLFGIRQAVAVPVSPTIGGVERVGSVCTDNGRSRHHDEEQRHKYAQVLSVVFHHFVSLPIVVNHFREPAVLSFQDGSPIGDVDLWEGLRGARLALGAVALGPGGDMVRFHASTGRARLFHIASQSFVRSSNFSQLCHGLFIGNPVFPLQQRSA